MSEGGREEVIYGLVEGITEGKVGKGRRKPCKVSFVCYAEYNVGNMLEFTPFSGWSVYNKLLRVVY